MKVRIRRTLLLLTAFTALTAGDGLASPQDTGSPAAPQGAATSPRLTVERFPIEPWSPRSAWLLKEELIGQAGGKPLRRPMAGEVDGRRPGEVGSVERLAMIVIVRVPLSAGALDADAARRRWRPARTVVEFQDTDRRLQIEAPPATVHWHEIRWLLPRW